MPALCLHCTRSFGSVAWRDVLHCSSVAFLLPSLPPSAFLVKGLPLLPKFFFCFRFFPCFGGLFILRPLGFWPQCDGCYSGGLGAGGGGLVAGLQVGRPVGVLPPWDLIAIAAPWPMGTQPPLATQAIITGSLPASWCFFYFAQIFKKKIEINAKIITVKDATYAVAKRKPEKIQAC